MIDGKIGITNIVTEEDRIIQTFESEEELQKALEMVEKLVEVLGSKNWSIWHSIEKYRHKTNEEKIVENCNQRDNMGDCFLLKETTEAMCAVISAARQEMNSWANPSDSFFYESFKKFDEMVIR